MNNIASDRRWPQFRLRALFTLVGVVAVLCWLFFLLIPQWHRRALELEWESQFKRFPAGAKPTGILRMRPAGAIIFQDFGQGAGREKDRETFWWTYLWPDSIHLLVFEVEDDPSLPPDQQVPLDWRVCRSFKAYRIRPAPRGYVAQTERGRALEARWFSNCICTKAQMAYLGDYADVLLGANKDRPEFPYELVYADPPDGTAPRATAGPDEQ
jgi:hypothetical protein